MKKLSLTQILLGAVVLYVLYRMFLVREGFDKKYAPLIIGLIVITVITVVMTIYYIGAFENELKILFN